MSLAVTVAATLVAGLAASLLDWVPSSATAVGVLAGPLVVMGYLAGSVPFAYLLSRRRLRRQLDDRGDPLARWSDRPDRVTPRPARARADTARPVLLPAATTLAATTVAWHLTLAATPGANTFSAVGVFSNQAIGAWVSVALWTGMAAVAGHVAPVWTGFRGGSGVPPAVALAVVYLPLVTLAAASVALVVYGLHRRPRSALAVALPVMVSVEYVTWLADIQAGWGVTNGPEAALWTTVLAALLAARNLGPARSDQAGATRPG